MLSKFKLTLSQNKKLCALVALVIIVGVAYCTGYFESAIPGIIAGAIMLLLPLLFRESDPKADDIKKTNQSGTLAATERADTFETEGKNAFDMLSGDQKRLVCLIQKWAKDNGIRDNFGHPLTFNSRAVNPNLELTKLCNEAKQKGFIHKPKEKT